jgi:hypothetical protein
MYIFLKKNSNLASMNDKGQRTRDRGRTGNREEKERNSGIEPQKRGHWDS